MARRTLLGATVGAVVALLLVAAASSGPVRLWSASASGAEGRAEVASAAAATLRPEVEAPSVPRGVRSWETIALQMIGLVVLAIVLATGVPVARRWVRPTETRGGAAVGTHDEFGLPDLAVPDLYVDVDVTAARAALAQGPPRNAIVACWLQLENDARAAGLGRAAPETSTEYVERVLTASSIDPAPIGELAALYREARFSRHELHDGHRARALAALARVESALQRPLDVRT